MISRDSVFSLYVLLIFSGSFFSSTSATPSAKIVSGILSNTLSALFKWLWSLKSTNKIRLGISSRSMMKFEGGYSVETVFDGSKVGIEPHSVEVTPSGELLVLDSQNSNIPKISMPCLDTPRIWLSGRSAIQDPSSMKTIHPAAYHSQMPVKPVRPPLIPPEVDEQESKEPGFFGSLVNLFTNTGSALFKIFAGLLSNSKKNRVQHSSDQLPSTPSIHKLLAYTRKLCKCTPIARNPRPDKKTIPIHHERPRKSLTR